jgi:hypothetical protein
LRAKQRLANAGGQSSAARVERRLAGEADFPRAAGDELS